MVDTATPKLGGGGGQGRSQGFGWGVSALRDALILLQNLYFNNGRGGLGACSLMNCFLAL